ncbi:MAG: hypothetical protein GY774_00620, partial [Planctomycetes bacterium]|nr:hypothetical protein [Planctomycetota bacterium]
IVVADNSALIALAICDSLNLLDELFEDLLVPESVYREVTKGDKPQANALRDYLIGKVRKVDLQGYVYLDAYADAGETEAMLLYKQVSADKLLIDDKTDFTPPKSAKTLASTGLEGDFGFQVGGYMLASNKRCI